VDGSIIRVGERSRYDISASVPDPDDLDMRSRNLTRPIEKLRTGVGDCARDRLYCTLLQPPTGHRREQAL
jgi:hypothetical protein